MSLGNIKQFIIYTTLSGLFQPRSPGIWTLCGLQSWWQILTFSFNLYQKMDVEYLEFFCDKFYLQVLNTLRRRHTPLPYLVYDNSSFVWPNTSPIKETGPDFSSSQWPDFSSSDTRSTGRIRIQCRLYSIVGYSRLDIRTILLWICCEWDAAIWSGVGWSRL